ncbi:exosome complex component RRP45-like [Paramacrobiotus metropolitanus]|uniref:exosome complex component RRP45-like n=1 Tax=Paramacrobiotus metropolitanus TaxID=2943436 RepID=UPI00244612F6|nr:exosome complex component RRP45-like [Paramacrobiotus metropolitanus]
MDGSYVSIAEKDTYLRFLKYGQREDKRAAFDYRDWQVFYTKDPGTCVVYLGNTTVMCTVKVLPKRTWKTTQVRGLSRVDLSLSAMSFSKFQPSRQRLRTIRKQLRQHIKSSIFWSKCVDDESLCISRGKAVFQVHISIDVIHADGNLFDATCMAAVACLLNTQRPEIIVEGNQILALSTFDKTPIPLQINHIPVSTTFGFQPASHFAIVDPSGKEEIVLNGALTIVVNQNGEICGTYKHGMAALPVETISRCAEIAALRAKDVAVKLRELAENDSSRRLRNESVDFLDNLRRRLPTGADTEKDGSITKRAQTLGILPAASAFPQHESAHILPKREEVRLPDEQDLSDEEGELSMDEDEEGLGSEEETDFLHSADLE